jgi:triosephosphate isomerase (TIM)
MPLRKLIAGNWKMNGNLAMLAELDAIAEAAALRPDVDVAIFPPATLLAPAKARQGALLYGAQDCHWVAYGAHTGCLSVDMIKEAGAKLVILGHSERRIDNYETNAQIQRKALIATLADLIVIVCVGETSEERNTGQAVPVVIKQLSESIPNGATALNLVIAYEPVWAIGSGDAATVFDVTAMHGSIRAQLIEQLGEAGQTVRILYGGSVRASNAAAFLKLPNVDGALVGGASLRAETFASIITAA